MPKPQVDHNLYFLTFIFFLWVIPPNIEMSMAYILMPVLLVLVGLLLCCVSIILVIRGRK